MMVAGGAGGAGAESQTATNLPLLPPLLIIRLFCNPKKLYSFTLGGGCAIQAEKLFAEILVTHPVSRSVMETFPRTSLLSFSLLDVLILFLES